MLCYAIVYYTILYSTKICCATSYYIILSYTILYYAILYYTIPNGVPLFMEPLRLPGAMVPWNVEHIFAHDCNEQKCVPHFI